MSEAQNTVALPPYPEIEKADALYGVSRWGGGFIRILENGHIGLAVSYTHLTLPTIGYV